MDETDRALIRATQAGLPVVREPYQALAAALGLDAAEVTRRLAAMLDRGVIRRIGAVPNHYRLGVIANGMTVWDVADAEIEVAGRTVGALPFVTHCYQRPRHLPLWPYNLFAMVHGRSRSEVEDKANLIAEALGKAVRGRDILYSTRILKKTGLRLD
ncbi:MAG: Lrp/AsnC family transcriptional regulator [Alphaproteobacteria bacterium]|nr:Lrp/AsnC family transcriptional regulator [Alphaproteobacteria bacterium]